MKPASTAGMCARRVHACMREDAVTLPIRDNPQFKQDAENERAFSIKQLLSSKKSLKSYAWLHWY
ncbi:hypothetical protein [Xanthomonas translucens]|uniref:hypothetical protein n=1 Tax=Xanthomonas campestris pv. translucens TaxID=343 RepID=UPI001F61AAB3|nr:hypothetical protein [Xanthomonas translucens]UNU13321.1 hypothetical protein KBV71_02700 [Xanthomonas translucens pv. translucens]